MLGVAFQYFNFTVCIHLFMYICGRYLHTCVRMYTKARRSRTRHERRSAHCRIVRNYYSNWTRRPPRTTTTDTDSYLCGIASGIDDYIFWWCCSGCAVAGLTCYTTLHIGRLHTVHINLIELGKGVHNIYINICYTYSLRIIHIWVLYTTTTVYIEI